MITTGMKKWNYRLRNHGTGAEIASYVIMKISASAIAFALWSKHLQNTVPYEKDERWLRSRKSENCNICFAS